MQADGFSDLQVQKMVFPWAIIGEIFMMGAVFIFTLVPSHCEGRGEKDAY